MFEERAIMASSDLRRRFRLGRSHILLVLLLLFHFVNNLIILRRDRAPFLWDAGGYFYQSLQYYDVVMHSGSRFLSDFYDVNHYRPPLFMLTSSPLYIVLGRSTDVAAMTNFIYLVILILCIYGIGRRISNEGVGLLAAFLISAFPFIFGSTRSYMLDFPLTAMVTLSYLLLMLSDGFGNRRYCVLLGISLGLGMLVKWTYFLFIVGPLICVFLTGLPGVLWKDRLRAALRFDRVQQHLLMSLGIGVLVASVWYAPNIKTVASNLLGLSIGAVGTQVSRFQLLGEIIGPKGIFTLSSLLYYAKVLVNEQISFFYAVLLAILFFPFLRREKRIEKFSLLLWVIIPVLAFTLIKNKTPRNTLPMLPAIALIMSIGAYSLKGKRLRAAMVALMLAVGFFQYFTTSYGASWLPKMVNIRKLVLFQQPGNNYACVYRADREDWKVEEILQTIYESRDGSDEVKIAVTAREAYTWMALKYTSYLKGLPFTFEDAPDFPESVLHADYVLVKHGGMIAPWWVMDNISLSHKLLEEHRQEFSLIKVVTLPERLTALPAFTNTKLGYYVQHINFSDKVELLRLDIPERDFLPGSTFQINYYFRCLQKMDADYTVLFIFKDRRFDFLFQQPNFPSKPTSEWEPGERVEDHVAIHVPASISSEIYIVEISLYDRVAHRYLAYQPRFLIYKRMDSD